MQQRKERRIKKPAVIGSQKTDPGKILTQSDAVVFGIMNPIQRQCRQGTDLCHVINICIVVIAFFHSCFPCPFRSVRLYAQVV